MRTTMVPDLYFETNVSGAGVVGGCAGRFYISPGGSLSEGVGAPLGNGAPV
jgi:hypothetical protein